MTDQKAKFDAFAGLHSPGNPVVLYNIWDAGTARALADAGARAIATGSYSVAKANGFDDGEQTPLDLVIENAARIASAVDLPVTIDFETGYGASPEAAAASLKTLLDTGIVGVNIEDGSFGQGLRPVEEQAARIEALAAVRSASGVPAWINARTDVFLEAPAEQHADRLGEALERGAAYAEAGGQGFFVPGLVDLDLIARVCESASLPVNVLARGKTPSIADYSAAGVSRVSYGGYPWRLMMKILADEAAKILPQR